MDGYILVNHEGEEQANEDTVPSGSVSLPDQLDQSVSWFACMRLNPGRNLGGSGQL